MQRRTYDRRLVPMAPVAVCLITGILAGLFLKPEWWLLASVSCTWITLLIAFFLYLKKPVAAWIAWTVITGAGFLLVILSDARLDSSHLVHQKLAVTAYEAEVLSLPDKTKSGFRTRIMIKSVRTSEGWQDRRSKALLYSVNDQLLMPGNTILVSGSPQPIRKPLNAFDDSYVIQLSRQNIFFRHRPKSPIQFLEGPKNMMSHIRQRTAELQNRCKRILDSRIHDQTVNGVMKALLLGVTDQIDPEVNRAFAETGTLHVLAVSGMHISLIYSMLLMMLYPATRVARLRWWVSGICILLLWTYAALTSFSPSVLRAVTMFSLAALARPQGKRVNIWNIYSAAVFLMLIVDPLLITRIGFLLSFLAVAGIIWIQPAMEKLITVKYKITHWLWSTICVSISAQLLTIPVTMAVFGSFPVYFLPANILIIPLSNVALASGLTMVAADFIPPLARLTGLICTYSVEWMNTVARFVQQLPFHQLSTQPISNIEAVLLSGMILCPLVLFLHRSHNAPRYFLACSMAWAAVGLMQIAEEQQRFTMTVYYSPENPTLAIDTQNRSILIAQDLKKVPDEFLRQFSRSTIQSIEIPKHTSAEINFGGHHLTYQSSTIAISINKIPDWIIVVSGKISGKLSGKTVLDCRRLDEVRRNPIDRAKVLAEQGAFRIHGKLSGTLQTAPEK